jgi:hypothetical protein
MCHLGDILDPEASTSKLSTMSTVVVKASTGS